MDDNPYRSPDRSLLMTGYRVRRGRRVLLWMAAILVFISLWEYLNGAFSSGWQLYSGQVVRLLILLFLLFTIWKGVWWTRYVLAAICGLVLYVNRDDLYQLPEFVQQRNFGDAGLVVVLYVGYTIVLILACVSRAISGLIEHRRDERELST